MIPNANPPHSLEPKPQRRRIIDMAAYARLVGNQLVIHALSGVAEKGCIEWDESFRRVKVINTLLLTGPTQTPGKSASVILWCE